MAQNPFSRLDSVEAIKKAYRKLSLTCHPDLRPDKEAATIEFRELTAIYQEALANVGKVKKPSQPQNTTKHSRNKNPPPTQLRDTITIDGIEAVEIDNFGIATRMATILPEIFVFGGAVVVKFKKARNPRWFGPDLNFPFEFEVPRGTKNGQKFRFQMPDGPLEIQVVSQRK